MELDVYDFKGSGVALAMYNVDEVCLFYYVVLVFSTLIVKIILFCNNCAVLCDMPVNSSFCWVIYGDGTC